MQPIGAVYSNMRRKSNTDPAHLINSAYQYNHTHHQHVMEAMKARADENKSRSPSLSSSKSSNLGGETPTKAHDPEGKTKTNITNNPLLTTDESKKSPSIGSKRSSLSPNPSLKSRKSSNLGEESPTRAHNQEDEAKKEGSDVSNPDGETPITGNLLQNLNQHLNINFKHRGFIGSLTVPKVYSGTFRDNKVIIPQTVCEGKADWIKKNLCCCFYRSEEQSQV